jgi:hypothetical protein
MANGEDLVPTKSLTFLRWEHDKDGFIAFCVVYALKRWAAGIDDDDTHILYVLLPPSHPVQLVADLVDFDLDKLAVDIIELVADQGVLCTRPSHKRSCVCCGGNVATARIK